jgi:hypothetical protein
MAAAVTNQKTTDSTQSTQVLLANVVLSGSYTTGGDTLNLSGYPCQSHGLARRVFFTEQPTATVAPSGYLFYYQPGTTNANGKLRIMTSATVEFSGAYNSNLTSAIIELEATFPLGR